MSFLSLFGFFGLMLLLAMIPSASVGLVVARSLKGGVGHGISTSMGIVFGDLVFIALALGGMGVVAHIMGGFFTIIRIAAGLYLIVLGVQLILSRPSTSSLLEEDSPGRVYRHQWSFWAGFLLTLGDWKAIIFYASVLPMFFDLAQISTAEILVIGLTTLITVGGVKIVYAVLAERVVQRWSFLKARKGPRIVAGGALTLAGGTLIVKS